MVYLDLCCATDSSHATACELLAGQCPTPLELWCLRFPEWHIPQLLDRLWCFSSLAYTFLRHYPIRFLWGYVKMYFTSVASVMDLEQCITDAVVTIDMLQNTWHEIEYRQDIFLSYQRCQCGDELKNCVEFVSFAIIFMFSWLCTYFPSNCVCLKVL